MVLFNLKGNLSTSQMHVSVFFHSSPCILKAILKHEELAGISKVTNSDIPEGMRMPSQRNRHGSA
jgi:hypothetical protein